MDDKLKTRLERWVNKIGYKDAMKQLLMADISASTATKLLAGTYPNQPKPETMTQIDLALRGAA